MTNWKDILERAVWTFVQGALGAAAVVPTVTDLAGWEAFSVAAATGGISAVLSFLKTLAQEKVAAFPETRALP